MEVAAGKFAFGVYEVDVKSGELRKNGLKIRIQEQPFQILLMLLEHPGEVVTRDELRQRLWPADTFVDFDHGLNTAINKLREALGDSAANPRFIETLARRGYRFIAPVRTVSESSAQAGAGVATGIQQTIAPVQPSPAAAPIQPAIPESQNASASAVAPPGTPGGQSALPAQVATPAEELPSPSRWIPRTLFGLLQLMYLVFYGIALANLDHIPEIAFPFMRGFTEVLIPLVLVTATVGIALRLYLLTAVTFDYQPIGKKFRTLFPVVLPLDQIWALSPFLLIPQIGIGGAFAACAALLYVPFSERTLLKMGYKY